MTATIEDVARKANVSVATVSRALRGLPNVAPSTRERVLAAARALHYVADPHAARLAAGRTQTVGLVLPMLDQWFHTRFFFGVEAVLDAAGYDVLPFTLGGRGGMDRFLQELPFRKRVDGLIVVDAPAEPTALGQLIDVGVPAITVGVHAPNASSLTIDNVGAARSATAHLLGLGHRRIGFIGGMADDPYEFSAPLDRRRGHVAALVAAGIQPDADLAVAGNFSLEGGAEAMERLLRLDEPPTAVFACSDEMAIGAMRVLRDAGLEVPDDVSVVGFDDHDVAEYLGLTTVRQDVAGQGERAAGMLLEYLRQERLGLRHEVHPTRLIVRQTTGPPPQRRRTKTLAEEANDRHSGGG